MAVSLSTSYNVDISSIVDPLRFLHSFDLLQDQMEITSICEERSGLFTQSTGGIQNLDPSYCFSDLNLNPKESWNLEFSKGNMPSTTVIDIQQFSSEIESSVAKKRRMDCESVWEDSSTTNSGPSDPKLSGTSFGTRDRLVRRKISGRLGWSDEIDFDCELGGGYLNTENFLSSLTANTLKQEVPSSPNNGDINNQKNLPQDGMQQQQQQQQSTQQQTNQSGITIQSQQLTQQVQQSLGGQQHQQQQLIQQIQNQLQQLPKSNEHLNGHLKSLALNTTANSRIQQLAQPQQIQQQQQQSTNLLEQTQNVFSAASNFDGNASNSPVQVDSAASKKEQPDDNKFQYVLAAATSIATKNNEETLTYLNQGQSYEIKLKKLGDLSAYRGKILKSIVKLCFHERRLQYMEKEQMQQWQASRPGERIVEVDVPLSYGLCHVVQPNNPSLLNTVEILWDPLKEVGVYIKVNCISTEFTPKKHGGEKGVPFRIQVETYLENGTNVEGLMKPIHAAACQIKVFKLKGADRKHKQDREKIQKRPTSEQEKYQPSYECTILNDISSDSVVSVTSCYSPEHLGPTISPSVSTSPIPMTKYENGLNGFTQSLNPIGINSVSSSNTGYKMIDQNMLSPKQFDGDDTVNITKDTTPAGIIQWMGQNRLSAYTSTFAHFSGADLLRMSKDDLVQICGVADGIRMYNILQSKTISPRLTIFVSFEGSCYHAVYLHSYSTKELIQKMFKLPGFYEHLTNSNGTGGDNPLNGLHSKYSGSGSNLYDTSKLSVHVNGPSGIHVLVTDEVLANIKNESLFSLEILNGKIFMKTVYGNDLSN